MGLSPMVVIGVSGADLVATGENAVQAAEVHEAAHGFGRRLFALIEQLGISRGSIKSSGIANGCGGIVFFNDGINLGSTRGQCSDDNVLSAVKNGLKDVGIESMLTPMVCPLIQTQTRWPLECGHLAHSWHALTNRALDAQLRFTSTAHFSAGNAFSDLVGMQLGHMLFQQEKY